MFLQTFIFLACKTFEYIVEDSAEEVNCHEFHYIIFPSSLGLNDQLIATNEEIQVYGVPISELILILIFQFYCFSLESKP